MLFDRLLNGLSQLRQQQEIEISQFKDENEILRKKFHEGFARHYAFCVSV